MIQRTKHRLAAIPLYLAGISLLGSVTVVFAFSGLQDWFDFLVAAWTSLAAVPFVVGAVAVAWGAANLSRKGRTVSGLAAGGLGTYVVFYVSFRAFASTLPPDPVVTPSDPEVLTAVLILGSPGILAGTIAPFLWGRWEAGRSTDPDAADA